MAQKKNPHRGSKFGNHLAGEGLLEDVTATAMERVSRTQAKKKQRVTKSAMA